MPEWLMQADVVFWGAITLMVTVPTIAHYVYKWHKANLENELKREMVARGMSADEICQILRMGSKGEEAEAPEEHKG